MRQRIAPEHACHGGEIYYNASESVRYTECEQTVRIQRDLTLECLKLLGPSAADKWDGIVINLGCGSGLCGHTLSERGISWIGADISEHMLGLAREHSICRGKLLHLDCFTHGALPFRDGCFGGAVSVSAVQWICAHDTPDSKALNFMREMYRILGKESFFIAQVYLHTDQHIQVLCKAASSAGLVGGIYTSFPHVSKAKKKFLCVYRPSRDAVLPTLGVSCCPVSWPAAIPCALPWLEFQKHVQDDHTSIHNTVYMRLCDEHRSLSSRVLRLVQRATTSDAQHNTHKRVAHVFECTSKDHVPCGGPFLIHVWNHTDRNEVDIVKRLFLGVSPSHIGERIIKRSLDMPWRDRLRISQGTTRRFCRIKILDEYKEYMMARLTADKIPPLYIVTCDVTVDEDVNAFARLHITMQKQYTSSVIAIDILSHDGSFSIACIYYIPEKMTRSIQDIQALLAM